MFPPGPEMSDWRPWMWGVGGQGLRWSDGGIAWGNAVTGVKGIREAGHRMGQLGYLESQAGVWYWGPGI